MKIEDVRMLMFFDNRMRNAAMEYRKALSNTTWDKDFAKGLANQWLDAAKVWRDAKNCAMIRMFGKATK